EYYEANREDLLRDYSNQWIAILDEKLVGAAPQLDDLLDELQGKDIPIGQALIEYVTAEEELWFFAAA
ncbi:MAG: DUF5678 domain-containing protein, partial [Vicinamibacterales bacterium]